MMGKDCERILSGINNMKDVLVAAIGSISNATNYRMGSEGEYDEIEREHIIDTTSITSAITSAFETFNEDMEKMKVLEMDIYTPSTSLNNSYGSPWKELHVLEDAVKVVLDFNYESTKYMGGKIALIGIMNIALMATVDAKWALTIYHDYIQRGFDMKFNGNLPSIVFRKANRKDSIGNINQQYKENVNVLEPSIDPF